MINQFNIGDRVTVNGEEYGNIIGTATWVRNGELRIGYVVSIDGFYNPEGKLYVSSLVCHPDNLVAGWVRNGVGERHDGKSDS